MSRYYSYATNPAGNESHRPVSRPYKQHPGTGNSGTQTEEDKRKTPADRIAACKARVLKHIQRVTADTSIPAATKTEMLKKLNEKMVDCTTAKGVDKEEKDKDHNDVENIRKGQGKLVSQITPGKLRKNPTVLQSLIDAIYAFFKNIENRPEPVDKFMAKYPDQTPNT